MAKGSSVRVFVFEFYQIYLKTQNPANVQRGQTMICFHILASFVAMCNTGATSLHRKLTQRLPVSVSVCAYKFSVQKYCGRVQSLVLTEL